ncbi:MAG: ParA family protein [Planctomycetaceae bacterium]|nr:ParA family protein [Planctomycetaceae bacterium]
MTPRPSSQAITVINLKGGVGKTHTTWLAASVGAEVGKRILIVDTDTQGNLSSSFLDQDQRKPGIEQLVNPASDIDPATLIRRTAYERIDIIPASSALAPFDLSNQDEWEKADLHLSFVDAVADLKRLYDLIVFDCPPRLSLVSFAALCASDDVVIPMEAADWGAQGIMQVTEAVKYVQHHHNADLRLLGYLVSRFKKARTYQQSYLKELRTHFGENVFDTLIPDSANFERSVTDRIPITIHAPTSREAHIARRFFAELIARAEGNQGSGLKGRRKNIQHAATVAGRK